MTDFTRIKGHAARICQLLERKDAAYGGSWCRRGGVGAFFSMVRKWDRIELAARKDGWDIFKTLQENREDVLDDVDDLIGYLLLIREGIDAQGSGTLKARTQEFSVAEKPFAKTDILQAGDDFK